MSSKDIIVFSDQEAVRKLLFCFKCKNQLNVSPVVPYYSFGYICGRCPLLSISFPGVKETLYERLVQLISLPCVNEQSGCKEILKINDIILHENNCTFRPLKCPLSCEEVTRHISIPCSWAGLKNDIQEHLKTHQNYFLDPPHLELSANLGNTVFFTCFGAHVATVVVMEETDKKYNVFIAMDGSEIESQCFRYQVEILNTDKNTSILLRKNRLYSLEDFKHSLNITEKQLVLNYENIFELLEKPKRLIMKFSIFKKSKKDILKITGFKDSELFKEKHIENTFFPKTDDNLLRELECPICSEYMLPPIYMCATGHGICSFCRNNITSCPTCRSKITDNRSFILENLISKINFPCRNREAGCKFVGTSDNIKAHQKNCSFRISCMLCDWEGALYDFHIHLMTDHKRHILEQNVYHAANFFDTFIGFLYVYNQVFCAIFRPSNLKCPTELSLSVSITHIFMDTEKPNFKYDLKFNPASCNNNSICFSNIPCIGTSCKDFKVENLGNLDCGILIPYNLLKIYTNEEKYDYKILIKKM